MDILESSGEYEIYSPELFLCFIKFWKRDGTGVSLQDTPFAIIKDN